MPEENISIFRQELERVKAQFEEKFQDIMASVRADRENDKRTLQMVNENLNNDRKAIDQNRALNDKLETMLNVQNLMLTELRDMNEKVKDLSYQAGGGGGLGMLAGLGLAGAGVVGADQFLSRDGDNTGNTGPGPIINRNTSGNDAPILRNINPINSDISQETVNKAKESINERLGREITDEEFRSLVAVTSSEGGKQFGPEESAAIIATVINRYEQTKEETGNENLTLNDIIFANQQFTPATSALTNYTDVLAGVDHEGFKRFIEAYVGNPDSNFIGGLEEFFQDPEKYKGVNYFAAPGVDHIGTPVEGVGVANVFRAGRPGNFSNGGTENFYKFLEYLEKNNIQIENTEQQTNQDSVESVLREYNINPESLRFDESGNLKNELYDNEGYPIRVSPLVAEELTQRLGLELPSSMEELSQDLSSRDIAIDYKDQYSPGIPTSSNKDLLITRSNETIRKYYIEALGLSDDTSMKEIREYISENDISIAPALKSIINPLGEEEDIAGMFRNVDDPNSRVQPAGGHHRDGKRIASHIDYSQAILSAKLSENSVLRQYLEEENIIGGDGVDTADGEDMPEDTPQTLEPESETSIFGTPLPTVDDPLSGGGGVDTVDGGIGEDMLVDTPQPEFDLSNPFPLVAPLRAANTLITSALPTPPEPETEPEQPDTPRMGGGTGTTSSQEPQIEANAIGRFPWAEKLIRYYNLSNMVKTNMLT